MHARMHASPYGSQACKSHQFDPQMWGGPYPSLKMVSLRYSLCSLLVRIRTGGKPKEIAEVWITSQGTRNGRSISLCAQACLVHVHMCAHLCVYLGVCVDVCKLACHVHANMCATRVALSVVCHWCQSQQATHQKLSWQFDPHNTITAAKPSTKQQQQEMLMQ